jgi:hypothetical protein
LKIINTSDKPFEWTFNGEIYGPIKPGQVMDLPDEIALHGIKRSVVLDDIGNVESYRVEHLEAVGQKRIKEIALYECPFVANGLCDAKSFKSVGDLQAHMESHWELSEPLAQKPLVAQAARK